MAKSTACALLKSNNRPIWGVMIWNNNFLEFDQVGFQKVVYVAVIMISFRSMKLCTSLDILLHCTIDSQLVTPIGAVTTLSI